MGKYLVLLLAACLTMAGCEGGSYFDRNTAQIKSDAVSRVTATGEDFRVYEFTPRTVPGYQCIFVAATQKAGLVCLPKVKP